MKPTIRAATASDMPALSELVRRYWAFEAIPGFDESRIVNLLTQFLGDRRAGLCRVADVSGELVGYLLASFVFSLEHGGWMAEIDEFYVAEELRGSGIGAALIDVATADMRAAGLVRVQLQLGNSNESGRRFYERHGYSRRDGFQLWDKPLQIA